MPRKERPRCAFCVQFINDSGGAPIPKDGQGDRCLPSAALKLLTQRLKDEGVLAEDLSDRLHNKLPHRCASEVHHIGSAPQHLVSRYKSLILKSYTLHPTPYTSTPNA